MNSFNKRFCFLALIASALVLAGCSEKPKRPEPNATVIGPNGAGGINPDNVNVNGDLTAPGTNGLNGTNGTLDANGQNRSILQPVYFAFDQSSIKPAERAKIQAAQKYLAANPTQRLLLEGHCDWRGTPEYNLGLGDRRANAVKQYLLTLGVPAASIDTLSKGSLDAVENADAATMAKERRVELVVLTGGTGAAPMPADAGAAPADTNAAPAPAPVGAQ